MVRRRVQAALTLTVISAGAALGGCRASGTDIAKGVASFDPTAATAMTAVSVGIIAINAIDYNIRLAEAQQQAYEMSPGVQRDRAINLLTGLSNGSKKFQELSPDDKKLLAKLVAMTTPPEEQR
ncbi:MAG: hypothetical protein ACREJO_05490 [Phycisphaerales bacterium]